MTDDISLLVEFLGKSAIVLFLGIAIQACLHKTPVSPAFRHSLWVSLFVAILLLPFSQIFLPGIGILPGDSPIAENGESIVGSTSAIPAPTPLIKSNETTAPQISLSIIFFGIWISGALFILLRSFVASLYLRRIEATASEPDRALMERIAEAADSDRKLRFLITPRVKTPFTFGILRPRIVLPPSIQNESQQDLEMILLHEIEHIRRYDALAVLITRFFLALNWVNPLAWIAHRQCLRFREEACDLRVVSSGHSASAYAEMLLSQAESASRSFLQISATAVAETGTIEKRIKMILNPQKIFTSRAEHPAAALLRKSTTLFAILAVAALGAMGKVQSAGDTDINSLFLPRAEFTEVPLADAVAFLQQKSREVDPTKKGINVVLQPDIDRDAPITLKLTNVPIIQALRYCAQLAGGDIKVDKFAVLIGKFEQPAMIQQTGDVAETRRKLDTLIVPSIEFDKTPFKDALQFLQQRSVELDFEEKDRNKKGINIILQAGKIPPDTQITLRLSSVPLGEALRYSCSLAQYEYVVEPHAVLIRGIK